MAFDPNAPISIEEPPAAAARAPAFDPRAPVEVAPQAKEFHPDEEIQVDDPRTALEKVGGIPKSRTPAEKAAREKFMTETLGIDKAGFSKPLVGFGDTPGQLGTVPKIPQQQSGMTPASVVMGGPIPADVQAGVANVAGETAASFTSPQNIAILLGTGGAGPLVQRLVAGGFGISMIKDAIAAYPDTKKILDDPNATRQQKTEAVSRILVTLGMGAAAGTHAVRGGPKVAPKAGENAAPPPLPTEPIAEKPAAPVAPVAFDAAAPVEVLPTEPAPAAPAAAEAPVAAEVPAAPAEPAAAPAPAEATPPPPVAEAPKPIDVTVRKDSTGEGWPDMYNLEKDVPGLTAGTYSRETIEKAGYQIPEKPAEYVPTAADQEIRFDAEKPIEVPDAKAELVPDEEKYPAHYKAPKPFDQSLGSVKEMLDYRQERIDNYRRVLKEELGISDEQTARLEGLLDRGADTARFERSLTPEQRQKVEDFFEGPKNQQGGPLEQWDSSGLNPKDITETTDKPYLADKIVGALGNIRTAPEFGPSDRFIEPLLSLHRLKELGGTWKDVSSAVKSKLSRMRAGDDSAELFEAYGKNIKKFAVEHGVDLALEENAAVKDKAPQAQLLEPSVSPEDAQKLYDEQSQAINKLSESKLLGLSKQLSIDPKGMSGERLRARIISNAHPEDIRDALAGRGLISGSEAEKWADSVIAKKRGQLNSGIDPEQFAAYVVKGASHIERGIKEFGAWSKEMVRAFGDEIKPHLDRLFRASEELNHEGAAAGNATPNQLKSFLADFSHDVPDNSLTQSTPVTRFMSTAQSLFSGKNPNVAAALKSLAGQSAPRTSALSENAGNALVRYASASIAAPEISRSYAGRVLGDKLHDKAFSDRLGAVLVEDRLRAIKNGFMKEAANALTSGDKDGAIEFQNKAQDVTSIIGKKGSPFASEEAFQAALKDKDINAALERHKEIVQPVAQEMHESLGGVISKPGETTGAFANLLPLDEAGESVRGQVGRGGGKGDFTRPLKKGSAFNRTATGSADNYNVDYNEIVRTMISGNFEETAKRKLYDALQESGLGRVLPPGEAAPEFNGQPARKIQIERRGLAGRTVVRNLWVDPRVYPEVVRGMNLDETFKSAAATHVANALNAIQIKGPVDGIAHIANILTSISGSQGGKSVVADLIRLRPGINVVDSISKVFLRARDVVKDSPEIRDELAKVAKIGAGRAAHEDAGSLSKFIHVVDKAARLVRNDMFDNLVERGLAKNSEAARREFINQIGQYNARLQGQITSKLKEWGASPFVVAGQAFNRNAFRRITANPGVEAASTAANVKLRTVELAGLAANLVAIPMAINYVLTNKPQGRPGVPFGAVDTGKTDSEGKAVYVDPQQWTGARRGLRLTGVGAVLSSQQRGDSPSRTIDNAMRDIVGGALHPFAGPAISTAATLTTGYNAAFYRQAEKAKPGESQLAENAKAAAKHLNPFVGNAIEGLQADSNNKTGGLVKGLVKPLTDAAGVKSAFTVSPEQKIVTKAHAFNDALGIPRYEGGALSEYSALTKAVHSGEYDKAKSELDALVEHKAAQIVGRMSEQTKTAMARREVAEYFRTKAQAPFTGSLARERDFKASLESDDRVAYEEARQTHRQTAQTVRGLLYGHH